MEGFPRFKFASPLSTLASRALQRLDEAALTRLKHSGMLRSRKDYHLNISYPALQVMSAVTADEVLTEMPERDLSAGVALYVHVPFCRASCSYCHYYKLPNQPQERVDLFLDGLERELKLAVNAYGSLMARSLYVGGGTPSYLSAQQIERLFAILWDHVRLDADAEVTFELHPENGDAERLGALARCGVNRLSMGVESFDDSILARENRRHTRADVYLVYERAIRSGLENINLDLIYGLRGQTLKNWEESLDCLQELAPASCTAYYLRIKEGTPEYKLWLEGEDGFPADDELLLMHAMTFERLESEMNYVQNPVDWFIRDNRYFHSYQDHNWRLAEDYPLLGLGPSAYSTIGGWQYYNMNDFDRWLDAVNKETLPLWRGEKLDRLERMRRTVMLGLKCSIDRKVFERSYGIDVLLAFPDEWRTLESLGLVEFSPGRVSLSYLGRLFADEAGRSFYSPEVRERIAAVNPALISTTSPKLNH